MNAKLIFTFITITAFSCGRGSSQKYFHAECCQEYCYSNDVERQHVKHLSSISAYQLVKGTSFAQQSTVPNCTAVRFWMLARHGTRLPEKEEIESLPDLKVLRDQIIENYETKKTAPTKGPLCDQDLQLFKEWTIDKNITNDKAEFLVVQGWNDFKQLAMDYKSSFPALLERPYDPSKFLFRHTNKQRTEASMKAFAEGLFGEGAYSNLVLPEQSRNSSLLVPMGLCAEWKEDLSKVNDPGFEIDRYKNSPMVIQMLADVSKRLGFERRLTFKEVLLIYSICAYETAWFLDKPSPWCAALTLDQVKIIEYENDLFYQYRSGYGDSLNLNLPCEMIKDMLTRINSNEEPLVSAYFTHSTMIQMFATALGLFKDNSPLLHSNYNTMENRKWRSSKMDPFAANYAVVKYDCSGNEADPSPKVKFFLNQKPLQLEGCVNGLCKLEDITRRYEKFGKADCMKIYCTRGDSSSLPQTAVLPTMAALVYNWFF